MDAIVASGLLVSRNNQKIIHNLTFSIPPGKLVGLVGPSGSGKTTLMRVIVGVQRYRGSLMVFGIPAGNALLRSRIGYATQAPAVYGDLTVEQNLRYFARVSGAHAHEVERVLKEVDMTRYRKRLVDNLSGGQRARVNLAVALIGNPDLLVLDEPTVGLDPILRNDLWQLFDKLAKKGKTLLISSHVMDEAERCDELVLLRAGEMLWNDSKKALLVRTKKSTVGDAFVAMIEEQK